MVFGGEGGGPGVLLADAFLEGLGGGGLAVGEENALDGLVEGHEPCEHFEVVGVAGEAVDGGDAGAYFDVLAEHADGFLAVAEGAAAGAFGLVADEEDGGVGVGEVEPEVVEDAAAGGHAGAGDDDGAVGEGAEGLGLALVGDEVEALGAEDVEAGDGLGAAGEVEVSEVVLVGLEGAEGHGGVEVDGDGGDGAGFFEFAEDVEEALGAADGEGGDEDGGVALEGFVEGGGELFADGFGLVEAVSVGGLHDEEVDVVGLGRGAEDGVVGAADVAGEDELALAVGSVGGLEVEEGGAEDVAHVAELGAEAWGGVEDFAVGDAFEAVEGALGVAFGEEGEGGAVLGVAFLVGPVGFFLLEVGGVLEEDVGELGGGVGGVDGTLEAVLDEAGEVADVVDVGVGEDDGVDGGGLDGEGVPVLEAVFLGALEEAAIDEDAAAAGFEEVAGAGDGAGGAEEAEGGGHGKRMRVEL